MVTIYALINPIRNDPFYVGSTKRTLSQRLSGHNNGMEGTKGKKELISLIKDNGLKVEIIALLVCSEIAAVKCEKHIYNLLVNNGYILHQDKNRIMRTNIKYYEPTNNPLPNP